MAARRQAWGWGQKEQRCRGQAHSLHKVPLRSGRRTGGWAVVSVPELLCPRIWPLSCGRRMLGASKGILGQECDPVNAVLQKENVAAESMLAGRGRMNGGGCYSLYGPNSYPKPQQHKTTIYCAQNCNLGRTWWRQFISAWPSWDSQAG